MAGHGVYFLANDRIIGLTIAFLNSFRTFNPDIPLCLIPFREDVEKLSQLKEKYNFSIFSDTAFLEHCDKLSTLFHDKILGHYRKLACWQGPFGQFIYIDVDMIVLKDVSFAFDLMNDFDFLTSCSNIAEAEKWVWKPSVHSTGLLSKEQISYAANTGFIVSQKGFIPADTLLIRAAEAQQLKEHMELYCMEQPFLNYLIVTSGSSYSSLWNLMDSAFFPQNYIEYWAGNGSKNLENHLQTPHNGKLREIFLIHWAGVWQLKKSEIELFKLLNLFKLRKSIWSVSFFMPLRKIWKEYRYKHL
jgi:hypothetical protein